MGQALPIDAGSSASTGPLGEFAQSNSRDTTAPKRNRRLDRTARLQAVPFLSPARLPAVRATPQAAIPATVAKVPTGWYSNRRRGLRILDVESRNAASACLAPSLDVRIRSFRNRTSGVSVRDPPKVAW